MPITTDYTEDHGVIITVSGHITAQECINTNSSIYDSLATIDWLKYKIVDFSQVTSAEVSLEELQQLAEQDVVANNRNPSIYFAIVVNNSLYQSMIKLWQQYTKISGLTSKILESLDLAKDWIEDNLQDQRSG